MKKVYLGATLLGLADCTSAGVAAIDPFDDLHCAVVMQTLEKNADQLGATPAVKRGLYVLQTWYSSKIGRERLAEAPGVVEALKNNPGMISSASQKCSNRAFSASGFALWKSIASDDYDQKVMQ